MVGELSSYFGAGWQAEAELVAKRPRQVALKGLWAQFVYCGLSYYFNVAWQAFPVL